MAPPLLPLVGFGDADAFYASAEAVRRPWLAGLPVGVLGNQGACVIARNYPMKKMGVKVGEPVWEAKIKCPDGLYIKRNFRWYEALSRRMLGELGTFSPRVEYYSIDEFFWTPEPVPGTDWPGAAVAVRDHIKDRVGVPMTVAFARTRTLAKLFADTAKPFGAVAVLDRDHERELLAKLPVRRKDLPRLRQCQRRDGQAPAHRHRLRPLARAERRADHADPAGADRAQDDLPRWVARRPRP
jgi:DNA polymerase V